MGCLAEDDVLELAHGRALGDAPAIEAHLAGCAACSALVAAIVTAPDPGRWGALVGKQLGPYRLDAQIGAGGMGAVYRARDERLGRDVAVKIVGDDRRVVTEARAAAAITHPNVVAVHDVGTADGVTYIVQELIDGDSVRALIGKGPMARERVIELGIALAGGLAAAHARGVVHRDLKPENLIVAADGALKILDFGLARVDSDGSGELDETEPSAVRGTVGYMAPEQARGEAVDARADVFAAGAVLYELVTGTRAFGGDSHAERLTAVLRDDPPAQGGELGAIIARCLDKDPRRRFQSAQDLAWVLGRLDGAPAIARPSGAARISRRGILLGAGAAAATGVAGYVLGRRGTAPAPRAPAFRQLTYRHGRVMDARFTHDGATILYGAAWEGGALRAYSLRLDSGATRPLDVPGADVLAVSRREVAIAIDRKYVAGQCATGTLAIVPVDGGTPRVIAEDVQDADFTPDGEQLALVRRGGKGFTLELPLGTVVVDEARWLTRPRVSPDGTLIAFLRHISNGDDRGEVMVVERATGAIQSLTREYASIAGLAWDPAGDAIWFTADELGANNAVRIVTLAGAERIVAATTGRLRIHDVTRDRRAAVTVDAWRLRTMVGTPGGKEVDRSQSEFSFVTDLSADGTTLLVAEFGDLEAANGAYLRPVAGGDGIRIGSGFPLALSPDGTRVLATTPERAGAVVYSTRAGGDPEAPLGAITHASWARWIDDRTLVVTGSTATEAARIWRVALDGAAPVALTEPGVAGTCELDPARSRAAFVDRTGRLGVVDLAGAGGVRWLPGTYADHAVCGWLATGAIAVRTTTTPLQIVQVAPDTGAATPLLAIAPEAVGLKAVDSLILRPDAGMYAYSYGQELSQLYLMS